jgi:hypothetical protein
MYWRTEVVILVFFLVKGAPLCPVLRNRNLRNRNFLLKRNQNRNLITEITKVFTDTVKNCIIDFFH